MLWQMQLCSRCTSIARTIADVKDTEYLLRARVPSAGLSIHSSTATERLMMEQFWAAERDVERLFSFYWRIMLVMKSGAFVVQSD